MTPRLKTELWVQAQIRVCDRNLMPIAVVHKGDADRGSVLLRLLRRDGRCLVLRRMTTFEGEAGWMVVAGGGEVSEEDARAYGEREVERDRDLWVVEIEDFDGRYELDAPVES
jgi:hypothetical protein